MAFKLLASFILVGSLLGCGSGFNVVGALNKSESSDPSNQEQEVNLNYKLISASYEDGVYTVVGEESATEPLIEVYAYNSESVSFSLVDNDSIASVVSDENGGFELTVESEESQIIISTLESDEMDDVEDGGLTGLVIDSNGSVEEIRKGDDEADDEDVNLVGTECSATSSSDPMLTFTFNGGSVSYDPNDQTFGFDSTPVGGEVVGSYSPLFFSGDISLSFTTDGETFENVSGHDFEVNGDLDIDGDFSTDQTGQLLTGEIISFYHNDSGGSSDTYKFGVKITGGLVADEFNANVCILVGSASSTFEGSFDESFGGNVNGEVESQD